MCFRRNEKEMKWNKLITCEHDSRAVWSENKNEKKSVTCSLCGNKKSTGQLNEMKRKKSHKNYLMLICCSLD